MGLNVRKSDFVCNNKGADQPVLPCRLVSAFVINFLDKRMTLFETHKILRHQLVFVAEQAGLSHT